MRSSENGKVLEHGSWEEELVSYSALIFASFLVVSCSGLTVLMFVLVVVSFVDYSRSCNVGLDLRSDHILPELFYFTANTPTEKLIRIHCTVLAQCYRV